MVVWTRVFILGIYVASCRAMEPFKPRDGSVPFLVYFLSRYRGMCMGTLLSRTTVVTAAVCVANPTSDTHDTRPINVVTGTTYRHPRRGIRVQVTKIILPKLSNVTAERAYMIVISPAFMILAKKVPDVLVDTPLRPISVDFKGEENLALHEQCLMAGWHFFYKGDKVYPEHKFLLQRNIRAQYLLIAKKSLWCNTISMKLQNALANLGYNGFFDKGASICLKDPERQAQPCHGMYGAPLICRGKVVALMSSPDAQWANCTGYTVLVNLFSASHLRNLMTCLSGLFKPEYSLNWEAMKKSLVNEDGINSGKYDYLPEVYDTLPIDHDSDESEEYGT